MGGSRGWDAPSEPLQLTAGPMQFGAQAASEMAKGYSLKVFRLAASLSATTSAPVNSCRFSGSSAGDLAFSTDGKWIAFVSYPERTLWRSRADGSDRRQLTFQPIVAAMPRWSSDASQLAFLDMESGSGWKILLLSAEVGVPQEMRTEDFSQADAAWSPDGQHLIALSNDSRRILLFDFNTGNWSDWISVRGTLSYPNWSSDGKYLYFATSETGSPAYYRASLDQSRPELLLDLP